ncbi:MAG: prolyl oligopeptidase family serine peptidase [Candidatus Poribacteria bacterium]|nr:prolyl oligopeptidase family serine peptidase [Candidatus Poribacteria bacterium]
MNSLTLEDLLKFNTFAVRVPIDISSDGNWIAYNTRNRKAYEGSVGDSAYSKTGVVFEMVQATVWVTNTRTGEHRNLTPNWGSSWAPRWSPDGARLAFFSDQRGKPHLFIWNRETEEIQEFTSTIVRTFFGFEVPKWTPDGRFILVRSIASADVPIFDESMQDKPQVLPKVSQETSFVEVYESENGQLQGERHETRDIERRVDLIILDTKTGKTLSLMKGHEISSIDIAPNGEQVAVMVCLGYETPTSLQLVYDLYVLPLPVELSDASVTEIEPLVRKIRLQDAGITVSWSSDSRYVAWTTAGDLASGDAFILDVETNMVRNITESFNVNLGRDYQPPLWIGESEALLCLAEGEIWKVPLNSGKIQNLTKNFEFSVHDVFYQSEGYTSGTVDNAITIKVYDAKRKCHSFYRFSLTDNTVTLLRSEDKHRTTHTGRFYKDVAEKTGEFIYVVESNQEPPNIWMSDANFESPWQITDINPHLQTIDFGRSDLIEWTLEDGETVKGILVLPSEASEKNPAPMIVSVYPGITPSIEINNTFALGKGLGSNHPGMFASRGYALLFPDFPIQNIEPYKQFSDVILPGVNAAISTKRVDAERLGVVGHSHGGYAVNVLITQTTRFKAAVAFASTSNLISEYLVNTGIGPGWYETGKGGMGGTLWEFPQRYIDGSPVFHLDKVETPLLLIHGDQDFVPFEQAQEMFNGLARLGKEVVLLKYKESDHFLGSWSNEKLADYWERVLNWFDEYLK